MENVTKLIYLLLLLSVSNVNINMLFGVNGAIFGLLSPIEVVEEWGCHDTAIRLTCGNLESKIAILEAIFTPNCTEYGNSNCGIIDAKGRLTRAFIQPRYDYRMEETEAGRRFLETLRKSHEDPVYTDIDVMNHHNQLVSATRNDNDDSLNTLKFSLEKMIVEYLRKLSPDDENDEFGENYRNRRNLNNETALGRNDQNEDTNRNLTEISLQNDIELMEQSEEMDDIEVDKEDKNVKLQIGARNITVSENIVEDKYNKVRKWQGEKVKCGERKRRITQLDRVELDKAIANETESEFNIRSMLNYRCSGKNHCSFVFAEDHPFSVIWSSGVVRIKYACIDDFRLNKYCGEHLAIGNEIHQDPNEKEQQRRLHKKRPQVQGEPVAQARIQIDQRPHQFTNLKILKIEPDDTSTTDLPNEQEQGRRKANIYSQDFRILKILPKNIEEFNDIEKIGDEFYFRKDENEIPNVTTESPKSVKDHVATSYFFEDRKQTIEKFDKSWDNDNDDDDETMESNLIEKINSTIKNKLVNPPNRNYEIIRNKESNEKEKIISIIGPELTNLPNNFSVFVEKGNYNNTTDGEKGNGAINAPGKIDRFQHNETTLWENEVLNGNPSVLNAANDLDITNLFVETTVDSFREIDNFQNRTSTIYEAATILPIAEDVNKDDDDDDVNDRINLIMNEVDATLMPEVTNSKNERISLEKSVITDDDNDDDDEDIYEDYNYYDEDYFTGYGRRKYKSIERVALRNPLQHGFVMTPGYPKFYIGETDCQWTISAPREQKIRLTILDISLRYEQPCKDYLQIMDLHMNRMLFNSCSDFIRPIEIISETNQLQVKVKTTTKIAFPKRGVLFHYTALGCLTPDSPPHVRLIHRTEQYAKFVCDPSFVFPDTAVNSRELICTSRHTWDKTLPDCIDKAEVEGSGVVAHFNSNVHNIKSYKKDISIATMVNDADMVYDILIPSLIIAGLFIVNAAVFVVIMRYRNKRKENAEFEDKELAEL